MLFLLPLDDSNATINETFLCFFPNMSSVQPGNSWTKHHVQETQPVTRKTSYSSVAVTLMPDFFWCSPIFHPRHLFLAPTPPLLGLLLALGEAAPFLSGTPFTQVDFLLPPSHHISLLHKVTISQLVTVSVSKNWGLFFRGWVFFSERKHNLFKVRLMGGEGQFWKNFRKKEGKEPI